MPHFDNFALDASPSMRTKDENGFLKVARTHITKETVNPYYGREIPGWRELGLEPEKIYYGYRAGKELEKAAHTFDGLPLLLGHHVESADDPQKEYRVGSLGTDAEYLAPYLDNSLFITDAEAIEAVESGASKELSCAYMYEPDFHAGNFNGTPYDFVMRNIRGNHVALVEEGRAGADVVVADAAISPKPQGGDMRKTRKFRGAKDSALSPEAMEKVLSIIASVIDVNDDQKAALAKKFSEDEDPEEKREVMEDEDMEEEKAVGEDEDEEEGKPVPVEDEDDEEPEPVDTREAVNLAEKNKAKAGFDEEMEADMKKAADACGVQYDEDFQAAFQKGLEYGKKDKQAEDEDEEGKPDVKAAMDAAIKKAGFLAKQKAVQHFRNLSAAANECRGVLGNIDPLAFDSANDIYGRALKACGWDTRKYERSTWRNMFAVASRNVGMSRDFGTPSIAQDAALSGTKYDGPFEGLNRIHR